MMSVKGRVTSFETRQLLPEGGLQISLTFEVDDLDLLYAVFSNTSLAGENWLTIEPILEEAASEDDFRQIVKRTTVRHHLQALMNDVTYQKSPTLQEHVVALAREWAVLKG